MYDQFGHNGPSGFGNQGANGYYSYTSSGFDGFGGFDDLGDIFSSIFGGGFGGNRQSAKNNTGPRKGADLETGIEITFEESYLGVKKEISLNRNEQCSTCHGEGAKPGTKPEKCTVCNGTGQVKQVVTTILRTNANNKNMY